jgi:hypothetical protein
VRALSVVLSPSCACRALPVVCLSPDFTHCP